MKTSMPICLKTICKRPAAADTYVYAEAMEVSRADACFVRKNRFVVG